MKHIQFYEYRRKRYGDELLVDAFDLSESMSDIIRTPVFSVTFYAIILVTDGNDTVSVNGHSRQISKGMVISSIPGEVWSFPPNPTIKAKAIFFVKEFLLSFFNDPHFISRLSYLQADRPSPFLKPDEETFNCVLDLHHEMRKEIIDYQHQDHHILRAMLYGALMLLQRAPLADNPKSHPVLRPLAEKPISRYVDEFVALVRDNFREEHSTGYYANRLCITPNYLNKIVQQSLGQSAKSYILDQQLAEACRLLHYTTLTVGDIANQLRFSSATYFVRIFSKYIGQTPLEYRKSQNK